MPSRGTDLRRASALTAAATLLITGALRCTRRPFRVRQDERKGRRLLRTSSPWRRTRPTARLTPVGPRAHYQHHLRLTRSSSRSLAVNNAELLRAELGHRYLRRPPAPPRGARASSGPNVGGAPVPARKAAETAEISDSAVSAVSAVSSWALRRGPRRRWVGQRRWVEKGRGPDRAGPAAAALCTGPTSTVSVGCCRQPAPDDRR